MFLRPRRFGKSLFLSTMSYDIRYKDNFPSLFGHLEVSKSTDTRTVSPNSMFVMKWDFSSDFEISLHKYLNEVFRDFKATYCGLLSRETRVDEDDAVASLHSLVNSVKASDYKLYLLIDEYDTSVNEAIKVNNKGLVDHLRNDTGILSLFRRLFSAVKAATSDGAIDRIFLTGMTEVFLYLIETGVSPLALNDFISHMSQILGIVWIY